MYSFAERLDDQYALNLAVLADLGFSDRQIQAGVPPFELIRDALIPATRQWLGQEIAQGYAARLTIAPSVQAIGLEGDRYTPGLIPRFDLKQANIKKGATFISKAWRTIGDKNASHDNGFSEPFSAAILLTPAERTLCAVGSIPSKMEALEQQRIEQARWGRRVVSAPIAHLVVSEAQSRQTGERSFHFSNASCLVHYPPLAGYRGDTRPTLQRGHRNKQRLELRERMLFVASEAVLRALHLPTATAKT